MHTKKFIGTVITLSIAVMLAFSLRPMPGMASTDQASLLIDMGNGEYYWADLDIGENRTAFNFTERAVEELDMEMEVEWFSFGAWVKKIGDQNCSFPHYWHFYYWDDESETWSMAQVGPSDYFLEDGESIALFCEMDYSDWSSPLPVPTPENNHPSTMFRNTLHNQGSSTSVAPERGKVKWDIDTGKLEIDSSPTVGWGKIFITGTNGFYALDQETGEVLWSKLSIKGMSSPALFDGKVLVGAADGRVYCLDAENGNVVWKTMVQPNPWRQSITSSPKVWQHQVFIGTFNETGGNASVVSLDIETGSIIWEYDTASVYASSPAIQDGVLYIGMAGRAVDNGMSFDAPYGLLALSAANRTALSATNGSILWMFDTDERVMSSPVVDNENIFFTSWDGNLYSVRTDGTLDWKKQIGESTSSPAISNDVLYVGTGLLGQNGSLLAYQSDGTLLWEYKVEGPIQSSPVVADGKVYFSTNELEGQIYCLDATEGSLIWSYMPSPTNYILSSPVVADGDLFIASDNGHVYAFSDHMASGSDQVETLMVIVGVAFILLMVGSAVIYNLRMKGKEENQ
jgi:outer membrane protein assembly factor BamB